MNKLKPLQTGDEIRVIAPSQSWHKRRENSYAQAKLRLEEKGFVVSYAQHIKNVHRFGTGSVTDRLADLRAAYADKNVRLVWCIGGGWSANELLSGIDWELVKANPKPIIGFSDITVLVNAFYAKTGQTMLLGPNFGGLGRRRMYEYSLENAVRVITGESTTLQQSSFWADHNMIPRKTRSWKVLVPGDATGTLIGGNVGTFYLLQGTEYQPQFTKDTILLVEDDDESGKVTAHEFDRRLESILQQPKAKQHIKGVLVGRFNAASRVSMPDIADIISRKFGGTIPVFADIDFGHTSPTLTFPIGGTLKMNVINKRPRLELVEY